MSQPGVYVYPAGGMSLNMENHANRVPKKMDLWIVNSPWIYCVHSWGTWLLNKDTFKIQNKGERIKPWPLSGVNRAADVRAWCGGTDFC